MDSTEYEPGTVAVVTARGVEGARAMWRDAGDGWLAGWFLESGHAYAPPVEVTEVRPLVVLDPEDYRTLSSAMVNVKDAMKDGHGLPIVLERLRDAIEAQTKPPRIPEPGLWGVVEANVMGDQRPQADYHWVHLAHDQWEAIGSSQPPRRWAELIDPTLIREGVES